eukprot:132234-Pyramimonas_sp.AAC.1
MGVLASKARNVVHVWASWSAAHGRVLSRRPARAFWFAKPTKQNQNNTWCPCFLGRKESTATNNTQGFLASTAPNTVYSWFCVATETRKRKGEAMGNEQCAGSSNELLASHRETWLRTLRNPS